MPVLGRAGDPHKVDEQGDRRPLPQVQDERSAGRPDYTKRWRLPSHASSGKSAVAVGVLLDDLVDVRHRDRHPTLEDEVVVGQLDPTVAGEASPLRGHADEPTADSCSSEFVEYRTSVPSCCYCHACPRIGVEPGGAHLTAFIASVAGLAHDGSWRIDAAPQRGFMLDPRRAAFARPVKPRRRSRR